MRTSRPPVRPWSSPEQQRADPSLGQTSLGWESIRPRPYVSCYCRIPSVRCGEIRTSSGLIPLRNLNRSLSVDSTKVVFSAMIVW